MKEKSPAVILWELAPKEQLKLKTSVFIATVGVIAGVTIYCCKPNFNLFNEWKW